MSYCEEGMSEMTDLPSAGWRKDGVIFSALLYVGLNVSKLVSFEGWNVRSSRTAADHETRVSKGLLLANPNIFCFEESLS